MKNDITKQRLMELAGITEGKIREDLGGVDNTPLSDKFDPTGIGRELFKLNKQFIPLLDKYISLWQDYRNTFEGESGEDDKYYLKLSDEWIKQLEDVKFKVEKGVW